MSEFENLSSVPRYSKEMLDDTFEFLRNKLGKSLKPSGSGIQDF